MANTNTWQTVVTSTQEEHVVSAATVTITGDKKVRICYLDKLDKIKKNADGTPIINKIVNFTDGQKCKVFELNELPLDFSDAEPGDEVILRVKSTGSTIVEFLPNKETNLLARFTGFWHVGGKESNATPTEAKKFKEGDADVLQFVPNFKIEGGMFDGKSVCAYLQFHKKGISKYGSPYEMATFPKAEDGTVGIGFKPLPNHTTGYAWSDKVYGLRHCGLFDKSITMPEDGNPLPIMEQNMLQANKLVEVDIEGGYVSAIRSAKKISVSMKPVEAVAQSAVAHEAGITEPVPAVNHDEM